MSDKERLARAIALARGVENPPPGFLVMQEELVEAVLDAMMEPGEGIINAEYERRYDGCVGVDKNQAKAVIKRDWQAMLQAMKEGK